MAKNFMLSRKGSPAKRSTGGRPFSTENQPGGGGRKPGMSLMSRVREMMTETSRLKNGLYNTRFDDVADAMVRAMECGSYVHVKEYIDREEGKVANRIADADGKNIKAYIGMPLDGPESP